VGIPKTLVHAATVDNEEALNHRIVHPCRDYSELPRHVTTDVAVHITARRGVY
jgi:hypothetical protein